MLPDGFRWRYILAGHGTPDTLMCDGYEVARLWQHVQTKRWHARLTLPGGHEWMAAHCLATGQADVAAEPVQIHVPESWGEPITIGVASA